MMTVRLGDHVRIDIPDEMNPDFASHGEHGLVLDIKHIPCPSGCSTMIQVAIETGNLTIDRYPWDFRLRFRMKYTTPRGNELSL